MVTATRKSRKTKGKHLNSAHMLSGADDFRPTTDTTFDIETEPVVAGEKSALSAETAKLKCIGYYQPASDRFFIAYDDDEAAMLVQFWEAFSSLHAAGRKFLGFNIFGFDLPFLMRRSWYHGIQVPTTVMTFNGRYFCPTFVDPMSLWKCGEWRAFISLDALSRFLGVGSKEKDKGQGEYFYLQWEKDRKSAIEYLRNDVVLVSDAARKMGLMMTCPDSTA